MDAKLKADWIAALRSGEYKQGRAALATADGKYCCLGVLALAGNLCDFAPETPSPLADLVGTFADGSKRSGMIPDSVCTKIGLSYEMHERCWRMNDRDRRSFSEIADFIEENIPADEHSVTE